jgi:hypothetical protein
MRALAALLACTVVATACATAAPEAGPNPAASPTVAPTVAATATPAPIVPIKVRSVTAVGGAVVAAGDFEGTKTTQVAVITDLGDVSLRIALRGSAPDGNDTVWFKSGPNFLALQRAKFVVTDVDADGRDDLVALYDGGANTSKLVVFRSTGTSFTFANVWWSAASYVWARARNIVSGHFAASGKEQLLITYQDDDARMRIQALESNGKAFVQVGTVYDSGPGKIDLARARFAVGHFTRSAGPEQLAAFYQTTARPRLLVFEPGPKGLTLFPDVYAADAEYDLSRASIAAADVDGDGYDDLVSLYTDTDGSAKVHLFNAAAGFRPVNGWAGVAALVTGSLCPRSGALVLGDWQARGKVDGLALAPTATGVRATVLSGSGPSFTVAAGAGAIRCPVWPLSGMPANGADTTVRPLYVKVDNNPSARPHYGIAKADMVYEWLVEGLTTRLAAVFQSQRPDVIGSVRSARMTDLPILPSLGAAFVYSGGGPEELMAIHYDDAVVHRYVDVSPNYGWAYRVEFRHAPYNLFTTYAALKAAVAAAPDGDQPAIVASWSFLETASGDPRAGGFAASVPATRITVPYRAGFAVSYTYDPATRTYARFQDGDREVDGATGQAIAARDIVVINTEVHFTEAFGLDPAGNPKLDMALTGTGTGVVFRDGLRQDVTWTRGDIVDAFTLRNASGEVVQLSPGQPWIHIVPKDWVIPSQ